MSDKKGFFWPGGLGYESPGHVSIIQGPPLGEWAGTWCGMRWRPQADAQPTWWQRFASRALLGVQWRRVEND